MEPNVLRIYRPLTGPLVVSVPNDDSDRSAQAWGDYRKPCRRWLDRVCRTKTGRRAPTQGDRDCHGDCGCRFLVGRGHLDTLVRAGLAAFGEVHVWTDHRATERCDTRCTNACGDECSCACLGANHAVNCQGGDNPVPWMRQVAETTLVNSRIRRALRVVR